MILRKVVVSPEARDDLLNLYDWISAQSSPNVAINYIERLETYVRGLDWVSERGTRRDDILDGLRIVGFEKRVTIAFTVSELQVTILGFFYGGQNWQSHLSDN
ncbi:MAG: type II toxin-antitoxin system RelE/ParE family toxin [Gallionellaceae bacterium]|jgi:toxin ParE1/3/4|nr:type II toxin-antitoxin system RelE/ParE family toxin [Gallionellaceae bacterium]